MSTPRFIGLTRVAGLLTGAALALPGFGCSAPDGAVAPAPPPGVVSEGDRFGLVALDTTLASAAGAQHLTTDAFFWRASSQADGCEVLGRVGECEISRCMPVAAAVMEDFAWLSAGPVEILGSQLDVNLTDDGHGQYADSPPLSAAPLWEGGEALTVVAGGSAEFPAFAVSAPAPLPVALTAPDLAEGLPELEPGEGLEFAWSSPRTDFVFIDVEEDRAAPGASPNEVSVRCAFPAEAGEAFIPPDVFAPFSSPYLLHGYRFWVSTETHLTTMVDDAEFTFLVSSQASRFEAVVRMPDAE